MKKSTEYEISKVEIEEYASKLAGKTVVMIKPIAYDAFFFKEAE